MRGIGQEFKEFIMRGNVVELAVAVVIAAAFGAVVTAFVDNLIMPLIALVGGQPDFSSIAFKIRDTEFGVGNVLTALVSFLIIAAVIFFFVVKPLNVIMERANRQKPADPTERKCPACFSDVPVQAARCRYCTSDLEATAAAPVV